MAKIFLDANYFIDAIHRKPEREILESLVGNSIYISPLSLHIYCYIAKIKIPDNKVLEQIEKFEIVEFTQEILERSLNGPIPDFEDNVQLHSAALAECEVFLTNDKELLSMQFFGKAKISSSL